jgi:hypothetical protein
MSETIKEVHMASGMQQLLVFMLTMKIDKQVAEISDPADRCRFAVDRGARSPPSGYFPCYDDFGRTGLGEIQVLHSEPETTAGQIKRGLNAAGVRALPDDVIRHPLTQHKTQGTHDYGLPCARLSGENVETGQELDGSFIYDCVITD